MNEPNRPQSTNWQQTAIEKVALAGIAEQKRARRWSAFFKIIFLLYIIGISTAIFMNKKSEPSTPKTDYFGNKVSRLDRKHIALIRLTGVISEGKDANAANLVKTLWKSANDPNTVGILINANSPGGSPVQSSLVYKAILAIKEKYPDKKIITYVEDICASGCYYIVSASDQIYADESSIVGSIGVISQSYGYEEAAKKLGIEPRTFTAGSNKDFMNPARPMREDEKVFLHALLDQLHQNFISAVEAGRGERIDPTTPDLFSGLFWAGSQAQKLGLIDGISTPRDVAKNDFGDYPVYLSQSRDRLEAFLEKLGVTASSSMTQTLEAVMQNMSSEKILFK